MTRWRLRRKNLVQGTPLWLLRFTKEGGGWGTKWTTNKDVAMTWAAGAKRTIEADHADLMRRCQWAKAEGAKAAEPGPDPTEPCDCEVCKRKRLVTDQAVSPSETTKEE